MTDIEDSVTVNINLYPEDGEEVGLRQIALGMQSLIILEAKPDDDGGLELVITGSRIDSMGDLVEMLEFFTESVSAAIKQEEA